MTLVTKTEPNRYEPIPVWDTTVRTTGTATAVYRNTQFVRGRVRTLCRQVDWKGKIRRGVDATGPYSAAATTLWRSPGWGYVEVQNFAPYKSFESAGHVFGSEPELSDPESLSTGSADNLALAKFYKKLRATYQAAQYGPALLEGRQTLQMLAGAASRLKDLAKAYKASFSYLKGQLVAERRRIGPVGKAAKKAARRESKRIAGLHLELTFGWYPFIEDIKDGAEALRRLNEEESRERVHAPGKTLNVVVSTPSYISRNNYLYWRSTRRREDRVKVTYIAAVRQRVYSSVTAQMVDLLGLTPSEIVPAIYEATPWSWAVDYFTNLGDLVQCWFTPTVDVVWANKSVKRSVTLACVAAWDLDRCKLALGQYFKAGDGSDCEMRLERYSFQRSQMSVGALPQPTFEWDLPNQKQFTNLAAVIRQLFK